MLSLYQQLIHAEANLPLAATRLAEGLNIPLDKQRLQEELEGHPDYPSLLSLSEVLEEGGLRNYGARLEKERLEELRPPFVAIILRPNKSEQEYTVVKSIDGEYITYMNPVSGRWLIATQADFKKLFQEIVLVPDMEKEKMAQRQPMNGEEKFLDLAIFYKYANLLAFPLLVLVYIVYLFFSYGMASLLSAGYLCLSLIGFSLSTLLLWYEIDQQNVALRQLCQLAGQQKSDCGAILGSKASRFLGLSWSSIGFAYFLALMASHLTFGTSVASSQGHLAFFSMISALYIPFSLYYQGFVARKWCPLCLGVQAVLALQFLAVIAMDWQVFPLVYGREWVFTLFSMVLSLVLLQVLLPVFQGAKKARTYRVELQRFKRNPEVFSALLAKQTPMSHNAAGLGVRLGSANAPYEIVKVCNPYCGPCAKAHPEIEQLLRENPKVQVRIIFTTGIEEGDRRTPPVRHLLAIAQQGNEERLTGALDDWYLAKRRDYDAFAAKYPMKDELKEQDGKLRAMRKWCQEEGITFTPTFFVNGYRLPQIYSVGELKYLLK